MDPYITYCFVLFMKQEVLPPTDGFIKKSSRESRNEKGNKGD